MSSHWIIEVEYLYFNWPEILNYAAFKILEHKTHCSISIKWSAPQQQKVRLEYTWYRFIISIILHERIETKEHTLCGQQTVESHTQWLCGRQQRQEVNTKALVKCFNFPI